MTSPPTHSADHAAPVARVISVRGSEAQVGLPTLTLSDGERATVGKFLSIGAGSLALVGMITEVSAGQTEGTRSGDYHAIAKISLMGEIGRDAKGALAFRRGVSEYPAIGDAARLISADQLRVIYTPAGRRTINIGRLNHDSTIPAHIDVDNLLSKHFAILGSTGVGKSSGVTVILTDLMRARPDVRIFLLDGHNEYGNSFGAKANVISPRTLRLPFWLFNFEELTDVIYGGRPAVAEEVEILAELIPLAKGSYQTHRAATDRLALKKPDPKRSGYSIDTPVPYLLQDLIGLIDERMGRLENRSSRMNYHRLLTRIETIKSDPRYAFMFENASVGGDTMASLLSHLFRLEPDGKPMTIMQLAGLPVEVVDAVVCVLCRLAFDFGLWSDGALPMLLVCEEAHRYAAADRTIGFGPTRRALSRIAKEGRKYGVFLSLVTQRPAELDPTIISQCSTLFAMRMANDHDQALLRSAVADAGANLLDFVSSLRTGEVVGFGEGMPMPARLTFTTLPATTLPRSESSMAGAGDPTVSDKDFVKSVVERWRGSTKIEDSSIPSADIAPPSAEREARPASLRDQQSGQQISRLLDDARLQILKR